MNATLKDTLAFIIFASIVLGTLIYPLVFKVIMPWITLEMKRASSRAHRPQPQEVWIQDEKLIYITAVTDSGVEVLCYDEKTNGAQRWKDTWAEWEIRLRTRCVFFTGMQRALR